MTANGQLESARAFAATALLIAEAVALYVVVRGAGTPGRQLGTTGGPVMKRVLLALAAALLVAGCGEKAEPSADAPVRQEPFTVLLDYTPNADHAGLYAALDQGLYKNAGLDVKLQVPPDPSAVLRLLAAGKADLAISYEPDLLLARDQGAEDLVGVAALVQVAADLADLAARVRRQARPPTSPASASRPPGSPTRAPTCRRSSQKAGVDPNSVKETNVGFNLEPALISKRADAALGAFWNVEGVNLAREGHKPIIQRMEKLGVPTYDELVLVARRQDLDAAGASRLRRFLSATAAGPPAAHARPERRPEAAAEGRQVARRGRPAGVAEGHAAGLLPGGQGASRGAGRSRSTGPTTSAGCARQNLLKRPPSEAPPLTNEFLPGEGRRVDERMRYAPAMPAHGA